MRRIEIFAFTAAALAFATPAAAQGRGKGRTNRITRVERTTGDIYGRTRTSEQDRVPPGQLPPAGMCRVWIDGVPPGQQPPVTDCATAQTQRTANSRVIYGDDTAFPGKGRRTTNETNGRVVTNDGRQCVERTDRNGNVRYECADRRYDPTGVLTDRSRVYGRDDDDGDRAVAGGARNAGKGLGKVKNKGQGKHGR